MTFNERNLAIVLLAVTAVFGAAAFVLFRFVDPNAPDSLLPGCLFYAATELYCIGCGMTRALHALAHGDLIAALKMNPFGVAMVFIAPLMLLHTAGWRPSWLQSAMRPLFSPRLWLILLPFYWVARNLPFWPFHLLAPG